MKLHRFIGDFDFSQRPFVVADRSLAHQLKDVLRLKPGEAVILGDGQLHERRATITRLTSERVEMDLEHLPDNAAEPRLYIRLFCSVLKRENFEWVVQKATEVGVSEIVPLLAHRTVKLDFKKERLEKIIKEAAEQSGRGIIPRLAQPVGFGALLEPAIEPGRIRLLCDPGGLPLQPQLLAKATEVDLIIGPEGGWEPKELELAKQRQILSVHLGPRVLRAETAAIVVSYWAAQAGSF